MPSNEVLVPSSFHSKILGTEGGVDPSFAPIEIAVIPAFAKLWVVQRRNQSEAAGEGEGGQIFERCWGLECPVCPHQRCADGECRLECFNTSLSRSTTLPTKQTKE